MSVTYITTGHHSALNGAPDQTEGIELFDSLRKSLVINHLDQTLAAPTGYCWAGEGRVHTGYRDDPEDPPGKYRYQGAFRRVTTTWNGNTDVHFHPCIARLNLSPLSVHSWIHITPTAPQVATVGGGAASYRNATHASPSNVSAAVVHRGTSTDGLDRPGLPRYAYIADCQADLHGFWWIGDWAGPLLSLSNQVIAVNLVTGAQVVKHDFASMGSAIASLTAGTDPTDPPWGTGFSDQSFQTTVWNVLGALDSDSLLVQKEVAQYTIETVSDFASKNLEKEFSPASFAPAPEPVSPPFSWVTDPPWSGLGTWYNWWVRDQLSSLGNGFQQSSIDTTLDDTDYDIGGGETAKAAFGTPRSSPSGFSEPGFALVNPTVGIAPLTAGGFNPPDPEGPLACASLAAAQAIVSQCHTDIDNVASDSRFVAFRQSSNVVSLAVLDPSDLTEESAWTPTSDLLNADPDRIIRGASIKVVESGAWSVLDLEPNPNFPGYYRPTPRTPPSGYIGGSQDNLSTRGMGQFAHAIFDQSTESRDQWSVRTMDAGNVPPPDAPSGLYFPEAVGGGEPTEHHFGGDPVSVHLVTIFAPSPAGYEQAQRPWAWSGCNYASDGTKLILLPRRRTQFRHVNHLIDGVSAHNAQAAALHQILCLEYDGGWSVLWTVDTYALMGALVENEGTGLIDERSGDCLSNAVLSDGYLYCVLYGDRGEYFCRFDATNGNLVSETKLTENDVALITTGREVVRDNLVISNRRPYLCGTSGRGYHLELATGG